MRFRREVEKRAEQWNKARFVSDNDNDTLSPASVLSRQWRHETFHLLLRSLQTLSNNANSVVTDGVSEGLMMT